MLDKKEIKKIIDLIKQGESNYRIWKITGHSVNTIDQIRKNIENIEKQIIEEEEQFNSPIDKTIGITKDIDTLIQTGQLNAKESKKWEKRAEQLREILKVETDDRISKERTEIVKEKDQEWANHIKQNYVKKEIATNLEKKIESMDTTIKQLRNENQEKDRIHEKDQTAIMYHLSIEREKDVQIQTFFDENKILNYNYRVLYDYVENRLDDEVRHPQEQLKHDQEVLNAERTRFLAYEKETQSNLNTLSFEVEEKRKANEIREKQLNEREEKQLNRETEFNAYKNRCENKISESITAITNRVEDIALDHCKKLVKRCFDKQINEIALEWKKINELEKLMTKKVEFLKKMAEEQRTNEERLQKLKIQLDETQEKQKCTIVHPKPCSGVTVVKSGFSP